MKNKKLLYLGVFIIIILLIVGIILIKKISTNQKDNSKESIEIVNGIKIEHSSQTTLKSYLEDKVKHKKLKEIIEPKLIFNMDSNDGKFDYYNKIINVEIVDNKVNFSVGDKQLLSLKENNDIKAYSLNNKGILFESKNAISVVTNNNVVLLSNVNIDSNAKPLISGKKVYYGTPLCKGLKSNGKEGEVVEIFEINLEKNTIQKIANLDHNKGWKC